MPKKAGSDGVLTFGDQPDAPRIRLNRRIERCAAINLDPDARKTGHPASPRG
ncbi:MAG: hypothetical protein IPL78_29215 [Chloroflexi bacterium]|nr:hypothetical protein [Chloroflexota bacterium]